MGHSYTGVVAMDANRAIGLRNRLPWHLPDDLKLFKRITTGHPVLMGRKTWESIGHPLPDRQNIVLTHDTSYNADGVEIIHDIADLDNVELIYPEVMVIGGLQVYTSLLPHMSCLYVSEVSGEYEADTFFPPFENYFTSRSELDRYDGFISVLYRNIM